MTTQATEVEKKKRAPAWSRVGLWLVAACTVVAAVCDAMVRLNARGRVYDDVARVPHNKVGLVLGTSPQAPDGGPNLYFVYRIDAAERLFKAGKIDCVLLSGDKSGDDYNEPGAMRDSLVARGVPAECIMLDYSGFRTQHSVLHARDTFGQSGLTIISQQFHNERALFLADRAGVAAVGYNAQDVTLWRKWLKIHSREYMARVKLFVDLARAWLRGEKI